MREVLVVMREIRGSGSFMAAAFPSSTSDRAVPGHFLLFFRNTGPETYSHLSADERQDLMTRWNQWFEGLVAQGKGLEGQPLEPQTRVVSGPGGRITDGPYPEAKEAIGGYVLVEVTGGWDEAMDIARRHPALAHGMVIEVRELTPGCHLGVTTRSRF